jgi:hypothetical protein
MFVVAQVSFRKVSLAVSNSDCRAVQAARVALLISGLIERGGLLSALTDPNYAMREMTVAQGGIGLAWPNEVDFSTDSLRYGGRRVRRERG